MIGVAPTSWANPRTHNLCRASSFTIKLHTHRWKRLDGVTRSSVYVTIRLGVSSHLPSSQKPDCYPNKVITILFSVAPHILSPVSPATTNYPAARQFIKLVLLTLRVLSGVWTLTCFDRDSSLLPCLTLLWAVITCYAVLWSSEVPLVSIALTSDDFAIQPLSNLFSFRSP